MTTNQQALRPTAMALAFAIFIVLLLQGFSVGAGVEDQVLALPEMPESAAGPHSVSGFVYWPDGSLETQYPITVTVTNNRTGDSDTSVVDVVPAAYPDGSYIPIEISSTNANYPGGYLSTDIVYVNCTYMNYWAHNESLVGSLAFTIIDLHLEALPFGPMMIEASSGGSITGYDGNVTLAIPAGSLPDDTVIYGYHSASPKTGALASIDLRPDGTTFAPAATLTWSFGGLDLGAINPLALQVFTYIEMGGPVEFDQTMSEGYWEALPTVVDLQAKQLIVQVSHFSNFSIGGAALTGSQSGLIQTYRGSADNPILDLAVTNTDLGVTDALDYIHIISNCTDDNDVIGVSIWNDTNDNAFIDAADVQLGVTQPLASGSTNFTGLGEAIPPSTTLNLLVCLDVSPTATIGDYLDLLVPVNGVNLANAGLSLEAVDPAGNTSIVQELTDPHVVYGCVSNILGPIANAWVNVTNNRTGITQAIQADGLSRYEVNIGLMDGGYLDGDEIFITADDPLGQSGWNVTIVNASMFGERCDIFISGGPYVSDETPANGTTISDLFQNVTVNITVGSFPLDMNTIVLEVYGTNFTWPDGNLSFVGDTLTFNTSSAFGNWSAGQTVDVTLWQVNDTLGNTGVNVPYSWTFFVMVNPVDSSPDIRVHKQGNDINITWMPVANATEYLIYRSMSVDGTGFNWSDPLASVPETYFIDAGALADGNNYSYVIRGANGAGEGPKSNIGWKKNILLQNNLATTSNNWIALPYFTDLVDAAGLKTDIGPACTKVSRMNLNTQFLDNYVGIPIQNFALQAGIGYQVVVTTNTTYTMVGSHDSSVTISLQYNAATTSNNWIALPYHVNITDAAGLKTDIGPSCTKVSKMNLDTQFLSNYVGIPIQNFALQAGIGYQVVVTSNSIWIPPVRGY